MCVHAHVWLRLLRLSQVGENLSVTNHQPGPIHCWYGREFRRTRDRTRQASKVLQINRNRKPGLAGLHLSQLCCGRLEAVCLHSLCACAGGINLLFYGVFQKFSDVDNTQFMNAVENFARQIIYDPRSSSWGNCYSECHTHNVFLCVLLLCNSLINTLASLSIVLCKSV